MGRNVSWAWEVQDSVGTELPALNFESIPPDGACASKLRIKTFCDQSLMPVLLHRETLNIADRKVLLRKIAESSDPAARHVAAAHPDTPAALLDTLASSKDRVQVDAVIANPSTPTATLFRLARGRFGKQAARLRLWTRASLADRKNSTDVYVRLMLAEDRNTPPEILDELASDPGVAREDGRLQFVVANVVRNPSTASSTLARISKITFPDFNGKPVCFRAAVEALKSAPDVVAAPESGTGRAGNLMAECSAEELLRLARSAGGSETRALANHPHFPWSECARRAGVIGWI